MNIILINGKARSGKDTFANLLRDCLENFKINVGITHNAKAVKDLAKSFFEWDEVKDTKGRSLLLDITNAGYNYDPYFWEKQTTKTLDKATEILIVPDWRYKSTFDYFSSHHNVITINITNENRESIGELTNHASETGLDNFPFDILIDNSGSLNDLTQKAYKVTKYLLDEYLEV